VLAVLTTHPIQYQVPIWKGLAERGNIPLKVFFLSDHGLETRLDAGFGESFSWDIDLLGGYKSEFLDESAGRRVDSFAHMRLGHGFGRKLRQIGANVLWIQGWQVAAYWQAVFEARRAGIEVWVRGETNARSNAGRIGGSVRRQLLRQLLRRIDRFLYIGEANRNFYLQQGVSEDRLAPAPYCVDNARFAAASKVVRPARDRIRQEWGIPPGAFCYLFAGKLIPKKRPFDLVEAARRAQYAAHGRKIHLLWAGTGELAAGLRQACDVRFDKGAIETTEVRTGGAPSASFVGFLNQSEISKAYAAADCLVLPSDAGETWGLVVNEAMASGLPCVVSQDCGCVEDLIAPVTPDLSFPMGDIDALQRAMVAAITNGPSPELLGSHISKYDVGRTIDAVESLYCQALTRSTAKSIRMPD
jgi:glycosyltransferase involved in cell wall biosynthesis